MSNLNEIQSETKAEMVKKEKAKKRISPMIIPAVTRKPYFNPSQLIQVTTGHFNISMVDFMKPKSNDTISCIKHILRIIIYKNYKITLQEIAELTGGKNHSTVISSIGVANDLLETNADFKEKYKIVEGIVKKNGLYNLMNSKNAK